MSAENSRLIRTAEHAPIPEWQLWFGIGGAPTAFALQELFGWFVGARICAAWSIATVRWIVAGIGIVAIAVGLWGLVMSWRNWQRASAPPSPAVEAWDRKAFMALGGALVSGMFIVAAFWGGLSSIFIDTCGWMR